MFLESCELTIPIESNIQGVRLTTWRSDDMESLKLCCLAKGTVKPLIRGVWGALRQNWLAGCLLSQDTKNRTS